MFDTAEFSCDENGVMTPTAEGTRRGWKLLWNGAETKEAMASAHLDNQGFVVFPRGLAHLATRAACSPRSEDFENFELHVDFQSRIPGANSGVFLRAKQDGSNPAFSGCEIQILDDDNWERVHKGKLEPWQYCGSIYGSSPPRVKGVLLPVGCWNTYPHRLQGSRLRVDLNGATVQDADVLDAPGSRGSEEVRRPGEDRLHRLPAARSGGAVAFRNVFVRRLP